MWFRQVIFIFGVLLLAALPQAARADSSSPRHKRAAAPDTAIVDSVNVRNQFKGVRRAEPAPAPAPAAEPAAAPAGAPVPQTPPPAAKKDLSDRVVDANTLVNPQILSALTVPQSIEQPKIAAEAPDSFKCMALANQQGDKATAQHCADMYVMYMANLMFQVRELSQMIGESLVRMGMVKEDDWVGAEQFMNRELALARKDESTPFQATNELALKRITPDPNEQAEVYVFCTLTNSFCREMAPNVERLWQATRNDPKVKLVTVLVDNGRPEFINSFREYTGLTAPIYVDTAVAKKLRIGFVPAVVVRSPSTGHLYTKTGFQSFERMWQFVRAVQGRSIEISPQIKQIAAIPVGFEKGAKSFNWTDVETAADPKSGSARAGKNEKPVVAKF